MTIVSLVDDKGFFSSVARDIYRTLPPSSSVVQALSPLAPIAGELASVATGYYAPSYISRFAQYVSPLRSSHNWRNRRLVTPLSRLASNAVGNQVRRLPSRLLSYLNPPFSRPSYGSDFSRRNYYSYPQMAYTRRARGRRPLSFRTARRTRRSRTYPHNRATIATPRPRAEIKLRQDYAAAMGATQAGFLVDLSSVSEGALSSQRENKVVRSVSLDLRGSATAASSTDAGQNLRVVVFRWNQGYMTPAVGTILETTIGSGPVPPFLATYNQLNAKNYKILSDKTVALRAATIGNSADFDGIPAPFTFHRSISDMITYNGTASADHDAAYYVMFILQNAVPSATISLSIAYRFIDI